MAFRRPDEIDPAPGARQLTAGLAAIGCNFAARGEPDADIEMTLVHASVAGMDEDDLRVLAVLTTWLGEHHRYVHVDRLHRMLLGGVSRRVIAYWAAVAKWLEGDRRFVRIAEMRSRRRADLLREGTSFQIERRGEDERFVGSALRVPAGVLRDRPSDVLEPARVAELHRGYRNRVQMGATWRTDVWTALEQDPELSTSEAARRAWSSFAVAWEVALDFEILRAAEVTLPARRGRRGA